MTVSREKWYRGSGIFPDAAEQKQPSRSQTLPDKSSLGGMVCFDKPDTACQNGYWVNTIRSVLHTDFSAKNAMKKIIF